MGIEKHPMPDAFEQAATRYTRALYTQLIKAKDQNDPIFKSFSSWLKKTSGFKTLEDIKDENNLEYQIFLFLCEHNIVFRLTIQHRYDLLLEFLTALTPKSRKHHHHAQGKDKLKQSVEELPPLIPKVTTPIEDIFERLKGLESAQIQFNTWHALHHALEELEYEHQVTQLENRSDLVHELTPIVEEMHQEIALNEALPSQLRNDIIAFRRRHTERVREIDRECASKPSNLKEQKLITRRVTQLVADSQKDFLQVIKKGRRATIKFSAPVEEINHKFDTQYTKNIKEHDALTSILNIQVEAFLIKNKETQTEHLANIHALVSEIQQAHDDHLTPAQQQAFTQFKQKLSAHTHAIGNMQTPKELQPILRECSQDLATLIRPLKQNESMSLDAVRLEEIHMQLDAFSHQETATPSLLKKNSSDASIASAIKAIQLESPLSTQPSDSALLKLLHSTHMTDTVKTSNTRATPSLLGDSPSQTASLQAKAKSTLQAMRIEHTTDETLIMMNDIQQKFEAAKDDEDEPLPRSDSEIQAIDKLISDLQTSAREGSSLDSSDLEELQGKIKKLYQKNLENEELSDINNTLKEYVPQQHKNTF